MIRNISPTIKLLPSDPNWFDGVAIDALRRVSKFEGMCRSVAFPDMHSGKDTPNGTAFLSKELFYPHLIGNDIGCGYAFWQTDLLHRKLKIDRATQRLTGIDKPWDGNTADWLKQHNLPSTQHDSSMGTIGSGNHFAELQGIEQIHDQSIFEVAGLNKNHLYLLIHSGSRGLGQSILRAHADAFGASGLRSDTKDAACYLSKHDHALRWAKANRELIAQRFATQINTKIQPVFDRAHNYLEAITLNSTQHWLHRKGASPTDGKLMIIPGSRGTLSYLVLCLSNSIEHLWSIAHGAGRKWDRHSTESRMRHRFRKEALIQTELGGRVICEDKSLLFQEAPQAYKNIDTVIQHLIEAGLIEVVATLRPLITYKKRKLR